MNTYRLTNTSHTEVALGLPLLSLPNSFGASRHELFLFDDSEVAARLRDTDDAAVVAHANKIAELLRATDISYLSLREEAKNGAAPMAAEPGSLMAAILQHEQDAFSYTAAGHLKRGGWQSSSAEKQSTVAVHQASPGGPSHQVAHQGSWAPSSSPVDSPAAVKVTGIKRKEATGTKVERQHNKKVASVLFSPVKFNQFTDTVVSGLCELLDEFFERTEAPGEDEGEEAGTFLSLPEIRSIAEDVVKLLAKNLIQNVPVEYLVRLLSLSIVMFSVLMKGRWMTVMM
ncbi:hypothetical protein BDL97_06G072000 [Sphagnum fallax]|nr:hypothetical protein BDL97_06G072000 [Sphagnum fallax]